jgi:hypothetical protein
MVVSIIGNDWPVILKLLGGSAGYLPLISDQGVLLLVLPYLKEHLLVCCCWVYLKGLLAILAPLQAAASLQTAAPQPQHLLLTEMSAALHTLMS